MPLTVCIAFFGLEQQPAMHVFHVVFVQSSAVVIITACKLDHLVTTEGYLRLSRYLAG